MIIGNLIFCTINNQAILTKDNKVTEKAYICTTFVLELTPYSKLILTIISTVTVNRTLLLDDFIVFMGIILRINILKKPFLTLNSVLKM